jgi:hypothetical protein
LFFFAAKQLDRHYLLSGDTDGAIILWELTLADKKVICFFSSSYVLVLMIQSKIGFISWEFGKVFSVILLLTYITC